MKKEITRNKREILDIHTHRNTAGQLHSIVNYPLRPLAPLRLSIVFNDAIPQWIQRRLFFMMAAYNLMIINMAPLFKGVYYSIGIHPWDALHSNSQVQCSMFKRFFRESQFLAIGEAGLDKLSDVPMGIQTMQFMMQSNYAEVAAKPMIIHCVKAMEELMVLKRELSPEQPWIWHGFRGKPEQAKQLLDQGFYLSFGEKYNEETMLMMPADRLFLETDDSKADIEDLLHKAAQLRGVEPDVLRETLYENAEKVFFKGQQL